MQHRVKVHEESETCGCNNPAVLLSTSLACNDTFKNSLTENPCEQIACEWKDFQGEVK